jgi:hypothetical protein
MAFPTPPFLGADSTPPRVSAHADTTPNQWAAGVHNRKVYETSEQLVSHLDTAGRSSHRLRRIATYGSHAQAQQASWAGIQATPGPRQRRGARLQRYHGHSPAPRHTPTGTPARYERYGRTVSVHLPRRDALSAITFLTCHFTLLGHSMERGARHAARQARNRTLQGPTL